MQIHYYDDLADFRGEQAAWLGLILKVSQAGKARLRVNSAANWHLRVDCDEQALLWAHMPEQNYQGLQLYRELSANLDLLPPITAAQQHAAQALSGDAQCLFYLRWFVHQLQRQKNLCFRDGYWVLHHQRAQAGKLDAAPAHYLSRRHVGDWQRAMTDEDLRFWNAPYVYIDWGWCGNASMLPLKPACSPDAGRLKWWRKQARLNNLPPILIWRIAALDCYLILDGHIRLQACLHEKIQPDFLVLDSFVSTDYPVDLHRAVHIEKQLWLKQQTKPHGRVSKPDSCVAMQQALIQAYDDRPVRRYVSYARASLDLPEWQSQVAAFIRRHGTPDYFQLRD